ncbi:MAG: STAS domain-containing protein [Clostridiales bacterium]|nr:STAS domain-containing protein [Clostridiales bacterium]
MLTSYLQDKLLTIALTGEIDHHSARQIIEQLGEKIDQYLPASCVLDFQGVSFMDSSGIAVVLNTRRRMAELGGTVCLQNVAQQPMKVLTAAGIEKIAKIG